MSARAVGGGLLSKSGLVWTRRGREFKIGRNVRASFMDNPLPGSGVARVASQWVGGKNGAVRMREKQKNAEHGG